MREIKCKSCKEVLIDSSKNRSRQYCDVNCQTKEWRRENTTPKEYEVECTACGGQFVGKSSTTKYCSPRCRRSVQNLRARSKLNRTKTLR